MNITIDQLVSREVYYCVSSLVSTLANGYGAIENAPRLRERGDDAADLSALTEQAFELCAPIDDWEEAALQEGARFEQQADGKWLVLDPDADSDMAITRYDDQRNAAIAYCDFFDIEPYEREVYEHWIVSDWLADQLAAKGEKVDKDFVGMIVWARTTTGQGIASDSVIQAIHAELVA